MKEALIIFMVLLLLLIISVFGGSIRHLPKKPQWPLNVQQPAPAWAAAAPQPWGAPTESFYSATDSFLPPQPTEGFYSSTEAAIPQAEGFYSSAEAAIPQAEGFYSSAEAAIPQAEGFYSSADADPFAPTESFVSPQAPSPARIPNAAPHQAGHDAGYAVQPFSGTNSDHASF